VADFADLAPPLDVAPLYYLALRGGTAFPITVAGNFISVRWFLDGIEITYPDHNWLSSDARTLTLSYELFHWGTDTDGTGDWYRVIGWYRILVVAEAYVDSTRTPFSREILIEVRP
jgi:hypothetical protein